MAEGDNRERTWQAGPVRVRVTLPTARPQPRERKEPLTTDRIVDAALEMMRTDGYDAVSMRSLARTLDTGPASLYQHVRNRDELDQLVLDRIASQIDVPEPDPERWAEQLKQMLRDTLAIYRAHPGSARAAMGQVPTMEGTMRVAEGMMAICLAGGISPQAAAWMCDVASLYVGALAYEESIWIARENSTKAGEQPDHEAIDEQMLQFWRQLPPERFPMLTTYTTEMTSGDGDERFEFGIDMLVSGLAAVSERYR
ncbi:MAG TPA: TetR/AcrR family transcriptional regulator [Nocardioides sp.]|uniref:TetR/AcrR family transcriptional regulator n=1 Tax=Nocardioides sp. TaxID=35761 RepID=UPI002E2F6A55|nr:TetR/AcrR family transcriptional regulator [Nocardioides sp.]HEX5087699.1 TetR/AcrR family transcriptional regulator [Nocardioides sp.]